MLKRVRGRECFSGEHRGISGCNKCSLSSEHDGNKQTDIEQEFECCP